jgi:D-alanyl-D-alanine carboxypeptidase
MDLFPLHGLGVAAALLSAAALADGPPAPGGTPLARCIAAEARRLDFSGVVSIAQPDGTTVWARGQQDKAGPIDAGTQFNLGSAGKMFTAVAVAQLVDKGQVRLDDAIGLYVKGLTKEASAVTVRQLLTHSSGLGNFFSPENLPTIEKARSVEDLLPLAAADKPAYPPGSRFQYSNSGFLLLGSLIERVSGQSYGDYLTQHLFGPAKMVGSGLDPASPRAVGMTTMPAHPPRTPAGGSESGPAHPPRGPGGPQGPLRPAPEAALHGTPAGGGYSTAADLQRFFAALQQGQLTSPAMLKELGKAQIVAAPAKGESPQLDYGFGFGAGMAHGHRWLGHNGGAPGVNVETAAWPDDHTVLLVMSNRDPPAATLLFRELRAALFDTEALQACAAHSP